MRRMGPVRVLLAMATVAFAAGCGGNRPALPDGREAASPPAGASGPVVEGESQEFKDMKLPPDQLTRAIPVGDAYAPNEGPIFRSMCLRCHSVSQTSFVSQDWRESLHSRAGVTCSVCHGTHESGFVPRPGPDRCILCHASEVDDFLGSAHGPARSPGVRCVSCHEAHATDRGLARTVAVCTGCHLDSDHVQGFALSRMGLVLAEHPPKPSGELRAPTCAYCHMPPSAIMRETGDFRNDQVTLHDPNITVRKHPKDATRLADETIEFMVARCVRCHSERNARYRLENSDPLIRHWTPVGMARDVRRKPDGSVMTANPENRKEAQR